MCFIVAKCILFSLDKNVHQEIFLGLTTACNKSTSIFVIVLLENCVRKQFVFFTTNTGISFKHQ